MKFYCMKEEGRPGSFLSKPLANDSAWNKVGTQGIVYLIDLFLFIGPNLIYIFKAFLAFLDLNFEAY